MVETDTCDTPWVRRYRPTPEGGVRLLCFPHAGGSASFFFPFSKVLPESMEMLAVQYPGRQDRRAERCVESITEMADEIFAAVHPWTDRPVALFGHSMGAVLAFEVAHRLERAGTVPVELFLSGRNAPSRQRADNIHQRDDDGIIDQLRLLNGTDSALFGDEELLRMVLPAVRSDYTAIETYRYPGGPALTCPITALVADDDPVADPADVAEWRNHTTGGFQLRTFTGGHFYLDARRNEVADLLARQLLPDPVH